LPKTNYPAGQSGRDPDLYRPAAGIVIFNAQGKVWMGKRKDQKGKYAWQFPQGGIDKGETPEQGAMRELWEETGLKPEHIEHLGRVKDWLYYDFPPEYKGRKAVKGWNGQRQKWYAVRLTASEEHFDLKAHLPIEFSTWRWENLSKAPSLIVPFKRNVYARLTEEFADFANA
jgi:putative (di)nucleoside polyphosphate hydrolase